MNRPVSHLRAIFYAVTGFTLWVFSDSCMKLASEMPVPKYEIMAIAASSGMVVLFLVSWLRGDIKRLRPARYGGFLLLGAAGTAGYIFMLIALPRLPLTAFYAIVFMAPIFISVLTAIFLHEKMTWQKITAVIVGFAGVLVAVNPFTFADRSGYDQLGYGCAFGGMVMFVTQMLIMRSLGTRESRECVAFYPRSVAFGAGLLAMAIWGAHAIPAPAFFFSCVTGGLGGIGWLCMSQAYKMAPAATVAPFHYSQIVTGAVVGYFVWHNVPSPHLLAGAAIIIGSSLYLAAHARKTSLAAAPIEPAIKPP